MSPATALRLARSIGRGLRRVGHAPTAAHDGEGRLLSEEMLRRLERLQLQSHRGQLHRPVGDRRSRLLGQTVDFSDHRPYTPGDDLRSVDWPAYARHGRLYVKVGPSRQGLNVTLHLDASASMAWGSPTKLQAGLRLTAALGYVSLAGGDRLTVRLAAGSGPPPVWGPRTGKRQIPALLTALEAAWRARPHEAPPGWRAATDGRAGPRRPRDLLVVVSDLYGSGALPDLMTGRAEQQALVLHLLHSEELQPSLRGEVELLAVEGGQRLALGLDGETLAAYRRELHGWLERLAAEAARHQAAYELIRADASLETQVLPFLWQRNHLQARED